MRKILFMARKEGYHILRDSRSLMIVIIMPIMMTFLYGYAINMDIENVVLGIVDYDRTSLSRDLSDRFYRSAYFNEPSVPVDLDDPEACLRSSEANAVLIIRPGYAKSIQSNTPFSLGMLLDGSDNNLAAATQNYAQAVLGEVMASRLPSGQEMPGITISRQVLYNPDLKSAHFFVPGLVAIILVMISALLTSITIARERETGTLEQLHTAPVKPIQILLGKLVPYIVIALIDGLLIVVMARIVFGVPFVGSPALMLGFGLIYVITGLALGILISTLVSTQQLAMMFALTATMLPSVMLSGFIFAIKNMPPVLQVISYIIPARYFIVIIRGIMLKGAVFEVMAVQGLSLLVMMIVTLTIATRRFSAEAK
ncbi:MAG: ABC transporter permease [candidate division Zixibacteria bacterium]|nr:ABC transporter permease [candidate division Zixibacteria bacterium]